MVSKLFQRLFLLVICLIFFISLVIIAVFFVFVWIMIYLVKVYFVEQDINDLKEISVIFEWVLNYFDEM